MSNDKISIPYKNMGAVIMEIHERLKATREDKDISQAEIAEHVKVSRKQISRWESKQSEMGIYKLREICLYYHVSADYILGLPKDLDWPR